MLAQSRNRVPVACIEQRFPGVQGGAAGVRHCEQLLRARVLLVEAVRTPQTGDEFRQRVGIRLQRQHSAERGDRVVNGAEALLSRAEVVARNPVIRRGSHRRAEGFGGRAEIVQRRGVVRVGTQGRAIVPLGRGVVGGGIMHGAEIQLRAGARRLAIDDPGEQGARAFELLQFVCGDPGEIQCIKMLRLLFQDPSQHRVSVRRPSRGQMRRGLVQQLRYVHAWMSPGSQLA